MKLQKIYSLTAKKGKDLMCGEKKLGKHILLRLGETSKGIDNVGSEQEHLVIVDDDGMILHEKDTDFYTVSIMIETEEDMIKFEEVPLEQQEIEENE